MMNQISKKGLLVSVSLLVTGASYANSPSAPSFNNILHNHFNASKTYTARGTTNFKTALMIKYLLKNPYLRVEASAGNQHIKNQQLLDNDKNNTGLLISYTIKGTTSKRVALQLKKLFETNQHISVSTSITIPQPRQFAKKQYQPKSIKSYSIHYPEYTPFYYKGLPPTYTNGRTLWMPIKIEERQTASKKKTRPMILKRAIVSVD
jgi:hypothetical protein